MRTTKAFHLHVPHTGLQRDRFTEAMRERNMRIANRGQPELAHACVVCTPLKTKDGRLCEFDIIVSPLYLVLRLVQSGPNRSWDREVIMLSLVRGPGTGLDRDRTVAGPVQDRSSSVHSAVAIWRQFEETCSRTRKY